MNKGLFLVLDLTGFGFFNECESWMFGLSNVIALV